MLFSFVARYISPVFLIIDFAASATEATTSSTPYLRIEGNTTTIFEGSITSGPRNLTAIQSDDGLTHVCDGVGFANTGAEPFNTALDALDQASKLSPGFKYTLGYDGDMTDFYIITLAGESDDAVEWGLLWNWKVPDCGNGFGIAGCRQQVQTGDNVLWAAVQSENQVFLKVTPSVATVKKGGSVMFTITDGLTGKVQPLATIHGIKANSQGQVVVNYPTTGSFTFKAKETGAVRSELVKVTVIN